jgi:hypothetical protein
MTVDKKEIQFKGNAPPLQQLESGALAVATDTKQVR